MNIGVGAQIVGVGSYVDVGEQIVGVGGYVGVGKVGVGWYRCCRVHNCRRCSARENETVGVGLYRCCRVHNCRCCSVFVQRLSVLAGSMLYSTLLSML